ncbi:MAG: gliding motility-associated C-terminal domain-containing protein [Saprospiraceae bacterium]|nr:gliding motility-associated C-terminal domain-containing protein [Saprospiraceae bacterium]
MSAILKKGILFVVLILFSGIILGQENCTNGIDDDGDGLVDLNDPDCECMGIHFSEPVNDVINNPDFEYMFCCPDNFTQMNCVSDWEQATFATTDYLHTCNYIGPIGLAGLVPFPSGQGCIGSYLYTGWNEFFGQCVLNPLDPSKNYSLSFYIACVSSGASPCVIDEPDFGPLNITLYGGTDCDIPLYTTDCPNSYDPDWSVLGSVTYDPVSAWAQVTIDFSPASSIVAIMLGGPCIFGPDYGGYPDCIPYFGFDDLQLIWTFDLDEIDVGVVGNPCDEDYALNAVVDDFGGEWQWYFNGVALPGQTIESLLLSENNSQSGTYTVTYSKYGGCVSDTIQIEFPTVGDTTLYLTACPDAQTDCAGEIFDLPGTYQVNVLTPAGCDSMVTCIITELPLPPVTYLQIDTCGSASIEICNQLINFSGSYDLHCQNWQGCDSLVHIELNLLDPDVVITPPGELSCDSLATLLLDGSYSLNNPEGETEYLWTGPFNGIVSADDEPTVTIQSAGKYCLTVIYENNGFTCSDSMCVQVKTSQAGPDIPLLSGKSSGCAGDTIYVVRKPGGVVPATSYEWIIDPALSFSILNGDTVQFVGLKADTVEFCTRALNECGASDTACWKVITHVPDTVNVIELTCDPSQLGTTETLLVNQYGCDSLVFVEKTLAPSDVKMVNASTCDPTLAGTDTLWLQNQYGCDSLVITTTNLLPSQQINQTFTSCDPAQAGLDTLFLTNQYGCDSTLYIECIYSGNYQETKQTLICEAGVNYADTLFVTSGPCDSLFITNYMYAPLDTTWLNAATCDPAQAGMTIAVQPSSLGCDSTIITSTSLSPSDSTYVSEVTCDPGGASLSVTILSNQYGCDSVVTTDIQYVGIDTLYVAKTTCEPSQVGTIVSVLPGVDCDTVLVTETTYVPFTQSEETIILCGQTGILSDTSYLQNSSGCDSLAIRYYEYVSLTSQFQIQGETCAGDQDGSIEIMNISGGQSPFELQLNSGGWQSATVFNDLSPGQYTILIRDAAGCLDTLSGLVITSGASVAIDAGPERIAAPGEVIDLSVQTTQSLSQMQWTASDPLSCPTCLQTALGPLTTNQTVVVTGWTAEGCSDTDALEVIIKTRGNIFIPNSFTPNGDGINDVFSIYGNDQVSRIRNLAIFDRWGNALYARSDLPINDPSAGWDGTFRDEVMDPGVYIYVVEVELIDGAVRLYKGDVTLTR